MKKHFYLFICFFLQLDRVANLNKYVQLLHLPECAEDIKHGTECTVAGWGITSSEKPSECLRETTLKIVDRKNCEKQYIKKKVKITSNMLCARGRKKFRRSDACQVRSSYKDEGMCF